MKVKNYEVILSALAEKLIEKDQKISIQEWQIEKLKKELAEAEKHLPKKGELEIR